jgi:hypothetical protein
MSFLFPQLKIKVKGLHFDTWGDWGTIKDGAEHPHTLRKWQKCWEQCICAEGGYFKGYGCQ